MLSFLLTAFISESPNYLFAAKKYLEGITILRNLLGDKKNLLNDKVVFAIEKHAEAEGLKTKESVGTMDLFVTETFSFSTVLATCSFINFFTANGIIVCLPVLIGDTVDKTAVISQDASEQIIAGILFSCILEIPAVVASGFIPNIKMLGRLNSAKLGMLVPSVFIFLSLILPAQLPVLLSIAKSIAQVTFNILCLYAAEHFKASHKSAIIGLMYLCGRLANIFSVYFVSLLADVKMVIPWVLCFLNLVSWLLCNSLPKDK